MTPHAATAHALDSPAAPSARSLESAFAECRQSTRRAASSFYWAMKLLPEPERTSTYTLYAWLRAADDLGDSALPASERRSQLEEFLDTARAAFLGADPLPPAADTPLWRAMRAVVVRHRIPFAHLEGLIQGQLLDQSARSFATCADLYHYCYRVASLVGLMCLRIWGFEETDETRALAEWRGIALQLTNILRDVSEDARRGRLYLPAELFAQPAAAVPSVVTTDPAATLAAMRALAARAAEYFARSAPLAQHVSPRAHACLFAMTAHYRALLARIERDPRIVLAGHRVRVGRLAKVWIVLRAMGRKPRLARSWLARS
jgi:phytoene synthase